MRPTVFEDPCPQQGHSLQDFLDRLCRKDKKSQKENGDK